MESRDRARKIPPPLPILVFLFCLLLTLLYSSLEARLRAKAVGFSLEAHRGGVQKTVTSYPATTATGTQRRLLPQAPPLFTHTPDSLLEATSQLVWRRKKFEDNLDTNVSTEEADFDNVILPLAHEDNERRFNTALIAFYRYVATSSELRNASAVAVEKIAAGEVDALLRQDIYHLVDGVYRNNPTLDLEDDRLLRTIHKRYRLSGLGIPQGYQRTRFAEIQKRLSTLTASFLSNLSEDPGDILITADEIEDMPMEIVERLRGGTRGIGAASNGELSLPLKYSSLMAMRRYCKNETTRQRVFIADESRFSRNVALFKYAVSLRDEAARLLGYANHAALRIEGMMTKTPETVTAFLEHVQQGLVPAAAAEIERLKKLKEAEKGTAVETFFLWDYDFYDTVMLEREHRLDQEEVAEFFPLQHTLSSMLAIFQNLFGLDFHRLQADDYPVLFASGAVWHADVQMYSVWNADEEGGDFVGYLYLDLHPREGKYGGAANFNIRPGFLTENGTRSYPATVLVCNFARSETLQLSLLRHDEIVTLFHELGKCAEEDSQDPDRRSSYTSKLTLLLTGFEGHSIHDIVSRTTYACFHGTSTAPDFVEAPSQMLENWCWVPSVIKALSRHYSYLSPDYYKAWQGRASDEHQPLERISDELIQRIVGARRTNAALAHLRSVHWSAFDMAVHEPARHADIERLDIADVYNRLRHEITMLNGSEVLGEGYGWAHGYTTDGHLFQGYDASNYAYLYSLVFSADMFDSAFKNDPMNGTQGRRYRHTVLQRGGSMDEMEILREFLGREPSKGAFFEALGLP